MTSQTTAGSLEPPSGTVAAPPTIASPDLAASTVGAAKVRRTHSTLSRLARTILQDGTVALVLAAATVAGFWQIALTGRILVGYDLFTYFYPYREVVDRALAAGRIPFWNPDIFLGVPMLANIQTAVFYPPHWLTLSLPAPQAITAQILLHVWIGGLGMYAFCRRTVGLDRLASIVGALVFMFNGFLSGQVGHPNQFQASIWLPIIFVLFDQACRSKQIPWVLATGGAIAMQFLAGHTQEFYLSMVALGLFFGLQLLIGSKRALVLGIPSPRGLGAHLRLTGKMLGLWLGELSFTGIAYGTALAFGVGLVAFQLLPTLELSGESIRSGGLSFREATSFSLRPWELLRSLLPGYLENPFSEYIAYVGVLPLGLALAAVGTRLRNPFTWFMLALAVGALILALGSFNPFAQYVYRYVPGISLFRVPARWLFLYVFALSTLAAIGTSVFTQQIAAGRSSIANLRRVQLGLVLVLVATFSVIWMIHQLLVFPRREVLAIWVPMIALTVAFILGALPWAPNRWIGVAIVVITAVELYFARGDLDLSHPVSPGAYTSIRPAVSQMLIDPDRFRILTISEGTFDPGDFADLKLILRDELTPERIQDYVTASKYHEFLTPNVSMRLGIATIDGYDGGVLPLRRYVDFKNVLIDSSEALAASVAPRSNARQPDGILREQLDAIPHSALLGMMNIRYVILDKARDPWVSNVYYDLGTTLRVRTGEPARLSSFPEFAATSLGLITYLQNAEQVSQGDVVATVTVVASDGSILTDTLRAGFDTAEGDYNRPGAVIRHSVPQRTIASLWKGNPQAYNYHATIPFPGAEYVREIQIAATIPGVQVVIRGASLVDDRTQASESLVLNPRWRLAHSGDLKVYENLDWRDRAFLTRDIRFVTGDGEALNVLRTASGRTTTIPGPQPEPLGSNAAPNPNELTVIDFSPERRTFRTTLNAPAYLVVSETAYPGWRARIDGEFAPIVTANALFLGVRVPAGERVIELEYLPDSFSAGLAVTQQAAVGGLAAFGIWFALRLIPGSIRKIRRTKSSL